VLNRLNSINKELSIGASVLVALMTNNKLYISNLGVGRALLVKNDVNNDASLRVIQVTVDHNLSNDDELLRLCSLGLDAASLRNELASTRCIGNYMGKGGYKDSEFLSQAVSEPISSTPEVIGPVFIDQSARFLLLLSGGLCKVLQQLFSDDLNIVNKELVSIVVQQFNKQSTLLGVSQSVINQISQLHHDLFMKTQMSGAEYTFHSRDDMTLLIRNFSFEMPYSISRSKSSTVSSMSPNTLNTITSYSSTNTSANYSSYPTERKTQAYVSFKEYFDNVEEARRLGQLPADVEFDDAPLE
jgi:TAK1-binding protein 1